MQGDGRSTAGRGDQQSLLWAVHRSHSAGHSPPVATQADTLGITKVLTQRDLRKEDASC